MAKVVKFLSPYQVARMLKMYKTTYQTILEDLIDEGDIVALYIDEELDKLSPWSEGIQERIQTFIDSKESQ